MNNPNMKEEEPLRSSITPENYNQFRKTGNLKWRNLIEAAFWGGLISYCIFLSPFIFKVKIILMISFVIPVVFVNIMGIKNRSILQFISDYLRFLKNRTEYHLRSVDKDEQRRNHIKNATGKITDAEGDSIYEKVQNYIKTKYEQSECTNYAEFLRAAIFSFWKGKRGKQRQTNTEKKKKD